MLQSVKAGFPTMMPGGWVVVPGALGLQGALQPCVCTPWRPCSPSSRCNPLKPKRTCSLAPCCVFTLRTESRQVATWRGQADTAAKPTVSKMLNLKQQGFCPNYAVKRRPLIQESHCCEKQSRSHSRPCPGTEAWSSSLHDCTHSRRTPCQPATCCMWGRERPGGGIWVHTGAVPAQQGMWLLLQEVHPLLTLSGQIVEHRQGNPTQKGSVYLLPGAPARCSWCQAGKEHEAATAVHLDRHHTVLEEILLILQIQQTRQPLPPVSQGAHSSTWRLWCTPCKPAT